MAATYDTAQTPTTFTANTAAGPWLPGNYTPPAGSNRVAFVAVGFGAGSGGCSATAVSLGGQAMTQVGTTVSDGSWTSISIWKLVEAGIAAMSGSALSITHNGSSPQAGAVCFTVTNSDGTTSSVQTGHNTTGATAAPGTGVTSTSDGLVVAAIMSDSEAGITVGGGSADDSATLKTAAIQSDTIAAASYQSGTGGTITPNWAQTTTTTNWSVIAFNVAASAGGETITVDKWFRTVPDVVRRKIGMVPSGTTGIKS